MVFIVALDKCCIVKVYHVPVVVLIQPMSNLQKCRVVASMQVFFFFCAERPIPMRDNLVHGEHRLHKDAVQASCEVLAICLATGVPTMEACGYGSRGCDAKSSIVPWHARKKKAEGSLSLVEALLGFSKTINVLAAFSGWTLCSKCQLSCAYSWMLNLWNNFSCIEVEEPPKGGGAKKAAESQVLLLVDDAPVAPMWKSAAKPPAGIWSWL